MRRLRTRRLARLAAIRCLRTVRRHHFSMLSVGVLGATLAVALTSSSFELASERRTEGVVSEAVEASSSAPAQSGFVATSTEARPRVVVYYVIDSEEQRRAIQAAVQADVNHFTQQNPASLPQIYRDFIWARDAGEESQARDFIYDLSILAETQDYQFKVVDLR